jgi:hypothetical protein
MVFSDAAQTPVVEYPYFDEGAIACEVRGSYADQSAETQNKVSYEWSYPLGEVVSELIAAGLRVQFLHEWPFACYPMFPFLVEGADGLWRLPPGMKSLPLQFSLRLNMLRNPCGKGPARGCRAGGCGKARPGRSRPVSGR